MRQTLLTIAFFIAGHAACAQSYDLLISGGRALDGTGNPAMYADVAIREREVQRPLHLPTELLCLPFGLTVRRRVA